MEQKKTDSEHNYINSIVDTKRIADLCKPKRPTSVVGLLSRDGQSVVPHNETLTFMLDEHLPGSTIIEEHEMYKADKKHKIRRCNLKKHKYLSITAIKAAIKKL
jgi:hypothetical protein